MYLPPLPAKRFPESLALLFEPVTLVHDLLKDNRVSQLTYDASQQLQRKLFWFMTGGAQRPRASFSPPMD
jgi:hypothetical protein